MFYEFVHKHSGQANGRIRIRIILNPAKLFGVGRIRIRNTDCAVKFTP